MEIYILNIKCVDGAYWEEEFSWVVELPSNTTLAELHDHILTATFFDDDHLAAFFTARNYYARKRVWLIDPERDTGWETPLSKVFPVPTGHRLFYLFDFGDNWLFSIGKRAKTKKPVPDEHYPNVIREKGVIPTQYPEYEF